MKEEVGRYKEYLEEQGKVKSQHEKEHEAIVTAEMEKEWSRKVQQWKKEKQARKHLMQEVMDARKKQLEEKCLSE